MLIFSSLEGKLIKSSLQIAIKLLKEVLLHLRLLKIKFPKVLTKVKYFPKYSLNVFIALKSSVTNEIASIWTTTNTDTVFCQDRLSLYYNWFKSSNRWAECTVFIVFITLLVIWIGYNYSAWILLDEILDLLYPY